MSLVGRRARRHTGRSSGFARVFSFWRRGNRRVAPRPRADLSTGSEADSERRAGRRKSSSARSASLAFAALRFFAALLLAALLGAGGYGMRYFLLHSPHFALRNVQISPTHHVTAEALRRRAAIPAGTNLFRLDLATVRQNLASVPWLRSVKLHRELPATLRVEVSEYEPVALICLDSLYLVSATGEVFKRAAASEYDHLPVLTGFGRAAYLMEPELTHGQIRAALLALSRYQSHPGRPAIGEVHFDRFIGVTLYTDSGIAIRLGQGSDSDLDARLRRFDAVWSALSRAGQKPVMLFLDNRAHPDHVTVRLAPT
jgi:cell division protein FtsQ